VKEMLLADGFVFDKVFPIISQDHYCCITLLSSCEDSQK
jgi:hypothetical protein